MRQWKKPNHDKKNRNIYCNRSGKYDDKWRKFSVEYRAANPFCVECLKQGVYNSDRIQVDHIIPLTRKPEAKFDPTGLQSLCISHHSKKTYRETILRDKTDSKETFYFQQYFD